jgi:hypothetical protein
MKTPRAEGAAKPKGKSGEPFLIFHQCHELQKGVVVRDAVEEIGGLGKTSFSH